MDVNQHDVVIAARRRRWARSLSSSHEGDDVDDKQRLTLLRVQPLYCGGHALSRLVFVNQNRLTLASGYRFTPTRVGTTRL